MKTFVAVLSLLAASPLFAQAVVAPPAAVVDVDDINTRIAAAKAAADAAVAAIPQPANAVPPAEAVGGVAGSSTRYRRMDDAVPRITRAASCTLNASGTCSVTWATALSAAPTIVTTPVNPAGSQPYICNSTSTPTTTGAAIKCWMTQTNNLAAVTVVGISVAVGAQTIVPATTAPSGTVVQIIALPPTQ